MRDLFDDRPANPVEAARRSVRQPLRPRFYAKAGIAPVTEGHGVQLDGKPVRTPARRVLAAPNPVLAEAIAAEWDAQRDQIEPGKMPLTRLANSIIDGVADQQGPVAAEIAKYLESDLLFYRATSSGRTHRAAAAVLGPDPRLGGPNTRRAFCLHGGRDLHRSAAGGGRCRARRDPGKSLASGRCPRGDDANRLGTDRACAGTRLFVRRCRVGAANVDEDWNMQQWGRDELALERREYRFAELQAAATVLAALSG